MKTKLEITVRLVEFGCQTGCFKRKVMLQIIVVFLFVLVTMVTCKKTYDVITALHNKGFTGTNIAANMVAP